MVVTVLLGTWTVRVTTCFFASTTFTVADVGMLWLTGIVREKVSIVLDWLSPSLQSALTLYGALPPVMLTEKVIIVLPSGSWSKLTGEAEALNVCVAVEAVETL